MKRSVKSRLPKVAPTVAAQSRWLTHWAVLFKLTGKGVTKYRYAELDAVTGGEHAYTCEWRYRDMTADDINRFGECEWNLDFEVIGQEFELSPKDIFDRVKTNAINGQAYDCATQNCQDWAKRLLEDLQFDTSKLRTLKDAGGKKQVFREMCKEPRLALKEGVKRLGGKIGRLLRRDGQEEHHEGFMKHVGVSVDDADPVFVIGMDDLTWIGLREFAMDIDAAAIVMDEDMARFYAPPLTLKVCNDTETYVLHGCWFRDGLEGPMTCAS
eukprot:TRINITY_DN34963_c0_g1_i1.p2 TRINITY_DN34963_c0_g1~~TRINITY_DN34963_c0_g1_i1.p2  ORF type:complete len:269 (-),score=48.00 TRINITY_DN34963_c0_g1_i1:171-977(-)